MNMFYHSNLSFGMIWAGGGGRGAGLARGAPPPPPPQTPRLDRFVPAIPKNYHQTGCIYKHISYMYSIYIFTGACRRIERVVGWGAGEGVA